MFSVTLLTTISETVEVFFGCTGAADENALSAFMYTDGTVLKCQHLLMLTVKLTDKHKLQPLQSIPP